MSQSTEKTSRRKKRRGSKGIWTLPLFAFTGVAFLLTAYLCQSAQLVRIQYEVLARRQEVKGLKAKMADLELSVQELTSLERVENVAMHQLKMVVPEERKVIEVVWDDSSILGGQKKAAEIAVVDR